MSVIHPTAVIGAPAFAFFEDTGEPDQGNLGIAIADDVYIQALVTVEVGTGQPTSIGRGCRIAAGAYIAHDATLGEKVRVAGGARIAGWCKLEERAYVGMGATIRQHVRVGKGSVVGMGAVVVHDVPPNCIVVGNPAKFLRLADPNGTDCRAWKWDGTKWSA